MNNDMERFSMEHGITEGSAASFELRAVIAERHEVEVSPEARTVMQSARAERDALRLEIARQTVVETAV